MLGPLGCARDVWCVPGFWVVRCAPVCHVCFSGGFHWFSGGFAPWLRRVGRVAGGSAVLVCVFGVVVWRGFVGLCLVVLGHGLSHRVLESEIWGIWGWCGVQIANFGVLGVDDVDVLVGVVGWLSVTGRMCVLLVFVLCPFWCGGPFSLRVSY